MTGTPQNIQDMIDDFSFLDDWEDRYMHVIELGKGLAPLQDYEKTDTSKVKGCVSQVWLVAAPCPDHPDKLVFRGDSDAHIVKGLVAVVLTIFSGRTPAEILSIDASKVLEKLDLSEHLSPQRSNGLSAMIARIRQDAAKLASA